MDVDLELGRNILRKYCNPDFKKVRGRKLVLALVEVAGCPSNYDLRILNGRCDHDCYKCWAHALLK